MNYYTAGRDVLQAAGAEKRRFRAEIARAALKKRRNRGTLLKPLLYGENRQNPMKEPP